MENKKILMFLGIVIILGCISCLMLFKFQSITKGTDLQAENKEKTVDKVSMVIKEETVTQTSATVLITDYNENTYQYDGWYEIQKKEENTWKELVRLETFHGFPTTSWEIAKGNQLQMDINWSNDYGELEKGVYKILKRVDGQLIWAEFTID